MLSQGFRAEQTNLKPGLFSFRPSQILPHQGPIPIFGRWGRWAKRGENAQPPMGGLFLVVAGRLTGGGRGLG